MQIIEQTDAHAAAIERLLDLTFGADRHHKTVYRLREGIAPAPGLSFVIDNGDGLAATLRFWPVALPDGQAALLLGPIAVRPDLAGRGYGRALMRSASRRRAPGAGPRSCWSATRPITARSASPGRRRKNSSCPARSSVSGFSRWS